MEETSLVLQRVEVSGDEVRLEADTAALLSEDIQRQKVGTVNHEVTVPTFVLDWLTAPGNWQNPVRRFLFSLPVALIATERPFPDARHTARQSAIDLAFEFQRLLDEGVVNNRAEIASRYGLSRARVTQVLNVLLLPPQVPDALNVRTRVDGVPYSERPLRRILALSSQEAQLAAARDVQAEGR